MNSTETHFDVLQFPPEAVCMRTIESLRSRGADDDTVRLCLGMNLLEGIIQANRGRKHHVFFASFPKSGTTYLHKLLLSATGYVNYLLDHCSEDQQQNIVLQWAPMLLAQNTVTQIHAFATAPNIRMLKALWIKPVVLVRNLFDTLVSVRDHILNEDHVIPLAQIPTAFKQWSEEQQRWFVVRMVTPWYLNFFASWQRASTELDVLWVTYERLTANPAQALDEVLQHSGLNVDRVRLNRAIANADPKQTRFNVGVAGRGRKELSDDQQNAVREIAATYQRTYDFSMIGV